MPRYIFDLETDGLLDDVTKILHGYQGYRYWGSSRLSR